LRGRAGRTREIKPRGHFLAAATLFAWSLVIPP
jgi:hypothetical protein